MTEQPSRLVVVSNRVPRVIFDESRPTVSAHQVGGLVAALYPALEKHGGLWFGWSGQITRHAAGKPLAHHALGSIELATMDLSEDEVERFYTGFCNRTLWPLFHSLAARIRLREEEYRAYRRINRRLGSALLPLLQPGDLVWIHDYHLMSLGAELRNGGWNGPLGFFLHTPFPPVEILTILPWESELMEAMLAYDLVGLHTNLYRRNFLEAMRSELGGTCEASTYYDEGRKVRVGTYPIGTDPAAFEAWAKAPTEQDEVQNLRNTMHNRRIILGIDRLDYTKGIPERLLAFARLIERFPSWRRRVSMVQVSVPSRTRVAEYMTLKRRVDQLVGEINGRFGELDWVPIRYIYGSFSHPELAQMYREAHVCLVLPLRDGMNLVCKEYVASQVGDPGVLVLSRFCGAAEELRAAVIVNPYDINGTARALNQALLMPREERARRMAALRERVYANTANNWRDKFLHDLTETRSPLSASEPHLGS